MIMMAVMVMMIMALMHIVAMDDDKNDIERWQYNGGQEMATFAIR